MSSQDWCILCLEHNEEFSDIFPLLIHLKQRHHFQIALHVMPYSPEGPQPDTDWVCHECYPCCRKTGDLAIWKHIWEDHFMALDCLFGRAENASSNLDAGFEG
ncbi:hypothetical protein N7466_004296 [Penicillium verhagenii]|uniref:uncharacterized protein n=1 Tax=Penicillium verhagenii TaxID=1562060 RepID=UPI002545504C|nr:uncharacterized protein N7466_004296 [Penicillium verhagenii]KAJ5934749.1 hypothetical protein N7466_004296 [Penicillium verhagenii]